MLACSLMLLRKLMARSSQWMPDVPFWAAHRNSPGALISSRSVIRVELFCFGSVLLCQDCEQPWAAVEAKTSNIAGVVVSHDALY